MPGSLINKRNGIIFLFCWVSILSPYLQAAESAPAERRVKRIRYWTAPQHTRVVLDLSRQVPYEVKVLTKPHRIVINIPSGRFYSDIKNLEVNDGVLTRIRVNRLRTRAQVVLDLPRDTEFNHFTLEPKLNHPHRIVIDLQKVISSRERKEIKDRTEKIARSGDHIIIIDPGHGGSKPGACSKAYGLMEKDIVLTLSRMIAAEIDKHEGFRAILTRDGDYDVGLYRRVQIARSHGGDCFVSVHLDGHRSSHSRGSGIFFLSLKGATDKDAAAVAERENMLLEMHDEHEKIEDDVQSILFDFAQNDAMHQSSLLAEYMGEELRSFEAIPFRGIKQGGFMVLKGISMPSVLVEAAFISNRRDVALIRKKAVLQGMAQSISRGIIRYFTDHPVAGKNRPARVLTIHVVAQGETLWGIAKRYSISVEQIRDLNGLGQSSKIRQGQKLRVISQRKL
ncbi:MAG: N-acetylmuramoyl-L-alanine amidase [Candidatus Krumholzibacteriota bacterium]|nr:N-acetylmuramoyl-L-alanine amidase [Candidatus Krumholzibacteriota bacterium]